jgi:hypothetical protein
VFDRDRFNKVALPALDTVVQLWDHWYGHQSGSPLPVLIFGPSAEQVRDLMPHTFSRDPAGVADPMVHTRSMLEIIPADDHSSIVSILDHIWDWYITNDGGYISYLLYAAPPGFDVDRTPLIDCCPEQAESFAGMPLSLLLSILATIGWPWSNHSVAAIDNKVMNTSSVRQAIAKYNAAVKEWEPMTTRQLRESIIFGTPTTIEDELNKKAAPGFGVWPRTRSGTWYNDNYVFPEASWSIRDSEHAAVDIIIPNRLNRYGLRNQGFERSGGIFGFSPGSIRYIMYFGISYCDIDHGGVESVRNVVKSLWERTEGDCVRVKDLDFSPMPQRVSRTGIWSATGDRAEICWRTGLDSLGLPMRRLGDVVQAIRPAALTQGIDRDRIIPGVSIESPEIEYIRLILSDDQVRWYLWANGFRSIKEWFVSESQAADLMIPWPDSAVRLRIVSELSRYQDLMQTIAGELEDAKDELEANEQEATFRTIGTPEQSAPVYP